MKYLSGGRLAQHIEWIKWSVINKALGCGLRERCMGYERESQRLNADRTPRGIRPFLRRLPIGGERDGVLFGAVALF